MSDEKKIRRANTRERKFAKVYVETGNTAIALKEAGYNPKNAAVGGVMGTQMRARPQVQREIERAFESFWPEADKELVDGIRARMLDPETRSGDYVKLAELLIKMKGHAAPTKHQRMVAKVSMPLPLPGDSEGDSE